MRSPLITASELAGSLASATGSESPVVLDVRFVAGHPPDRNGYLGGHIPGAAYVDLDADLAAPAARPPGRGGRHPLPEPETFRAAMRRCGVGSGPVVVYDDWGARAAARCWWLLRDYGHRDVRVLDGGWAAWQRAGLPTQMGEVQVRPGHFDGEPGTLPRLEAAQVPGWEGTLIDAREPERFRGEVEPLDPVAGHIPGALNVPTSLNLDSDGRFRPAADLARLYPAGEVATYCGSGVTAAHDLLALAVLGRSGTLYPGSWSEWVSDPGRPTATG